MGVAWRKEDLELFESISRDEKTRELLLRMASLSHAGRLAPFLEQLAYDRDVGVETAAALTELATDTTFLRAVEEYLRGTTRLH